MKYIKKQLKTKKYTNSSTKTHLNGKNNIVKLLKLSKGVNNVQIVFSIIIENPI